MCLSRTAISKTDIFPCAIYGVLELSENGYGNFLDFAHEARTVCLKSIANASQAVPGSLRSPGYRFQRRPVEGQMQSGGGRGVQFQIEQWGESGFG